MTSTIHSELQSPHLQSVCEQASSSEKIEGSIHKTRKIAFAILFVLGGAVISGFYFISSSFQKQAPSLVMRRSTCDQVQSTRILHDNSDIFQKLCQRALTSYYCAEDRLEGWNKHVCEEASADENYFKDAQVSISPREDYLLCDPFGTTIISPESTNFTQISAPISQELHDSSRLECIENSKPHSFRGWVGSDDEMSLRLIFKAYKPSLAEVV
jgi:hypothetical protein